MKKLRKMMAVVLISCMVIGLMACGSDNGKAGDKDTGNNVESSTDGNETNAAQEPAAEQEDSGTEQETAAADGNLPSGGRTSCRRGSWLRSLTDSKNSIRTSK